MTATEKYKRAEALFNDRTKRELADMVVHREADLEDARAENEELWALNEHMGLKYMAAMGELGEENDQLKAENDKLHKLVSHLRTCMEHYEVDGTISCDRCPLDNNTGNCDFERRMSEMGVVK